MIDNWITLLEGIVSNPETPIANLSIISPSELNLMIQWNQTDVDFPNQSKCLHQLFEDQVKSNIALIFDNTKLTYKELNSNSNQLAHHLISLGIVPDTPVAILMDNSIEIMIAILGILKSGGAYVPIDPETPIQRIQYILNDAKPLALIVNENQESRISSIRPKIVICLDSKGQWKSNLQS